MRLSRWSSFLAVAALAAVVVAAPPVAAHDGAPAGEVTWNGYGSKSDGAGGLVPKESRCAPGKYALAEGPYLLFALESAKYLTDARIEIDGTSSPMTRNRRGSTYTYLYTAASIDLAAIRDAGVTVTYTARKRTTPKIALERGCVDGASTGIRITVVYLGAWPGNSAGTGFANLGEYRDPTTIVDVPQAVAVCETAAPTNCVSFAPGAAPQTTGSITLGGPGTLDLSNTPFCGVNLYGSAFAYGDTPPDSEASAYGDSTTTTTVTETASRTVYLVSWCQAG